MTPSQLLAAIASSSEFIARDGGLDAVTPPPARHRPNRHVREPFLPPFRVFPGGGFTFTPTGFTGGFSGGSGGFSGGSPAGRAGRGLGSLHEALRVAATRRGARRPSRSLRVAATEETVLLDKPLPGEIVPRSGRGQRSSNGPRCFS